MLKKLKGFDNVLTNPLPHNQLNSVIAQLEKYGAIEGRDYVVVEVGERFEVRVNVRANNKTKITGLFQNKGEYLEHTPRVVDRREV